MWNKLCSWATPLKFWFQTDLSSTGFYMRGRQSLLTFLTMSRGGHALRLLFMLCSVKIWQVSSCRKCMRHLETCFLIAEADGVLCRQLVMFLTVFFHWIYKMNTAGLFIGFVVRNALLVKIIGNPISRGIVFVFHLAWCVRGFKGSSDSGLTWWPSGAASRLVSLSNYCIWCGFFSGFLKSSVG